MSTEKNLKEAFAGESQANRTYLAFAKKADAEGFKNVGRLFRAAAEAETVHALSHLNAMNGVKATGENLAAAVSGEAHEFTSMYPGFISEAEKEGNKRALLTFRAAMAVEKIHHALYQEAHKSVLAGEDLKEKRIFVCQVCGNTVYDNAPDKCPICGVSADKFKEIV